MKLIAGIVVAVLIIQLIPVDRDNPSTDPAAEIKLDGEVKLIIQTACYDCHSNNTKWPWYSYFAPVSWLVAHDVHEAREEMNFSQWDTFSAKRKDRKLREIVEEVEEEEMPLPIYILMHSNADLSLEQREILINWAKSYQQQKASDTTLISDSTTIKISNY